MVDQDAEHLKLLSILHYIWGGLIACFSCFGMLYVFIGIAAMVAAAQGNGGPPAFVGAIFSLFGAIFVVLGVVIGGLTIWTGRNLAQRRRYVFCFVMACISCLSVPFGTALGVFTMVVLQRPAVKAMFERTPAPILNSP